MFRITLTLLCLFVGISVFAQKASFEGQKLKVEHPVLESNFKAYQVYQIDATAISQHVQANMNDIQFELQLGTETTWNLQLAPNDIRSEHYNITTALGNNIDAAQQPIKTFQTYSATVPGQLGALTIDENFLYGFTKQQNGEYFIEPLRYFVNGAAEDHFVVYASKDVIEKEGNHCGVTEMQSKINEQKGVDNNNTSTNNSASKVLMDCYEIELAIASDWLMFQDYGSVAGVENHNIGVMNNVATNYDDEFNHEFQFVIVTQFVSDCSTCDPWTNSTDPGALLDDFRAWGNAGNFGVTFDIGQCWTDRNFNGGTVGLAWVGVVCGSFRYHVLQDFTNNANFLRVMTAHEIGHNCGYVHDAEGSPFIMAPVVSASTIWSGPSITAIDNHLQGRINNGCLSACGTSAPPPIADFSSDVQDGCVALEVQFSDNSGGGAATSWAWDFPGGIPATSTDQNPLVTYLTAGSYDVTLEVTNAGGSDVITQTDYITVGDVPTADFDHLNDELEVTFINLSTNANSYAWDFGDGSSSTEENPVYLYDIDGVYTVILEAFNDCGVDVFVLEIEVVSLPIALFSADIVLGCIPTTVTFEDLSTPNATAWDWSFPGGEPSTSTEQFPVVDYLTTGFYDVSLTVSNAAGSDTYTETNFIEVLDLPIPGFTFSVAEDSVVTFTNTSTGAASYLWDFGDGNTSTETNPVHTYSASGDYTVTLEITNFCGSEVEVQMVPITIEVAPVAAFTATPTTGCEPMTVTYTDQSSGATSWAWSFPGGTPATSTDQNPVVEYTAAGSYDVSLTVTNSFGENTISQSNYIVVDPLTVADFTSNVNMDMVDFTNSSIEGTSFAWDFGDSNTSTDADPSHVYTMDGSYEVELISTNSCGSDTTSQTVVIVTLPTAAFSAPVTSGCADLTVNFSDESTTNATSWTWTFAGGTPATSTDQNPLVVYSAAGTYDVILEVSNGAGSNTSTQTSYVTVTDVPVSSFTTSSTDMTVVFTNTTVNGNSYAWDFGDGNTSVLENPTHTYAADGTYAVTLTSTNDCGDNVITQTVIISNLPIAGFGAPITTGCADLTVNFTNQSSSNATTWDWAFPGGTPATSTDQNPVVVYSSAGSYNVTLIVGSTAGNDTLSQIAFVNVEDIPSAGFTNSTAGTIANFTNTSSDATSYSWDFGDGNSSTDSDPSHDYGADGTYTVVLSATNACGTDMFTQTVVISNLPSAGFISNVTSGCADLEVTFSDQSSANAESWSWSFPGGTPSSSTAENPTVTYSTAGTYDVTLTVSNGAGDDTETQSSFIVVTDIPSAGFTNSTAGTTSNFSNTSSDATSYSWDFGDGNNSTDSDPSHDYGADGTYTVVLSATNACGTDMFTQTVVISNLPSAGFISNVTSGCADLEVTFSDQSSANAESWSWSFPGGTPATSTAENPTVTYSTAGTYDVTLTVSNGAGEDTETQSSYIVVTDIPSAGFTNSNTGTTSNFTNTSSDATSYTWDFGDGNNSTDSDPSHDYGADGTYTVVLSATNACGTDMFTQTVVISTLPSAGFSSNVTSGCADLEVTFSDQSSANAESWSWSFPGGTPATSTAENPTVTYSTAGTYDVTLTVSNGAGEDTETQSSYIVVTDIPSAGFTNVVTDNTVSFTNTTSNATSYSWDFGDGNTSNLADPTNGYLLDGTYTVTLTATNACGSDITTQTLVISTLPSAGFMADVISGCADLVVNFSDQSSLNAESWSWSFPGGTPATSTAENPVVTYSAAGTYDVSLTVSNAAGEDTEMQTSYVIVTDVPTAGFTSVANGTIANFTNTSTNATSYSWDFGDSETSGDTNPTHIYAADGTYTVSLIATNDCGSITFTETVTIETEAVAGFEGDVTIGCGPLTVNFTDMSSPNTTAWNWNFDGANPETSTEQNPTIVFDAPGSYSVTLVASAPGGDNTFTQTSYITVLDTPTAAFTSNVGGTVATFSNNTTNGDSYLWDFGDGNTSTDPNPSNDYLTDGVYTVTLMATNQCGTVTVTETVTIVTPPSAGFSADVLEGCAALTVSFMDQSSLNATSWNWVFTGGTPATSTEQNPLVVFENPGTFGVSLEVDNSAGSDMTAQAAYIVVNTTPTASYTSSVVGATATFVNASINAMSYSWDFGDGNNSTLANPEHSYLDAGTYTVVLTATNDCGSVTSTETVTIVSPPAVSFIADVTSGCGPLTVNFTDQSIGNVLTWDWTFTGATPATSNLQNPVVEYNTPGIYSVTLVATTSGGAGTFTQTAYISVLDVPTAAFNSSGSGFDYDFANTSTNATSYSWEFGDGGTSTMEDPSHTYSADGVYTVSLVATNACGSVTTTEQVTVATAPVADFTSDFNAGCAPLVVSFQDLSSANTAAWSWTFAGGSPASSTDQNPVVTYDSPGTYPVTLIATNGVGDNTVTQTGFINVTEAAPLSGFSTTVAGSTVDFESTSTGAANYAWDFGDGNISSEENPEHTYMEDGTYDVILTVSNGCGTSEITETVVIATLPTAGFTADILSGCAPLEVGFTNMSSNNAVTWSWTFDGAFPSSSVEENPIVAYGAAGTYNVTLVATNAQGDDSVTEMSFIVVDPEPTANFDFSVNIFEVDFTNNSLEATSYSWDFGDGNGSVEESPTHTYAGPGTYEVEMTVTNDCGTQIMWQTVVIESGVPPAAGFTSDNTTGCMPFTVNFEDQSSAADSWVWTFEGGTPETSTEVNPTVVYDAPGVYQVSLAVTNAFGSNSISQVNYITVEDVPTASFTLDQTDATVAFTNTSSMASSYSWDFGDGEFSGLENPVHVYATTGTYEVILTVTNQCGSTTFTETVEVMLDGFNDPESVSSLNLYPNPNGGLFTFELEGVPADEVRVRFYNIIGQVVFADNYDFSSGNLIQTFDFSHLAAATYIMQLNIGNDVVYRKVIVE